MYVPVQLSEDDWFCVYNDCDVIVFASRDFTGACPCCDKIGIRVEDSGPPEEER